MEKKQADSKWMTYGILISLIAGLVLGYLTEEPYLGIAIGMIVAFVVQRMGGLSKEENGDDEGPPQS